MILIITCGKPDIVNNLANLYKSFDQRQIPYEIVNKCDYTITRRKDIRGLILPGSSSIAIHYEKPQDELELELYYLYHFPKLPVLGICHGCQLLMVYYGGDLVHYDTSWIGSKHVELDLSRDRLFHDEKEQQQLHFHFHDLPILTPKARKAGVREIAWITQFRDGRRHACAFEFKKGRVYGCMFHPEATNESWSILYNFYDNVCMSSSASASVSASVS
jgi:GMP synthase-like glutamine amidotransferase